MTEKAILGRGRFARVVIARHVAMWICRNYCNMSYPEIGAVFGRNHTTIISAVRNVDEMRSWGLAEVVDACRVAVHRATAAKLAKAREAIEAAILTEECRDRGDAETAYELRKALAALDPPETATEK